MHIGFITPEYVSATSHDGGLANYLKKVGMALTNLGHRVTVFVISDKCLIRNDGGVSVNEIKRVKCPIPSVLLRKLQKPVSFLFYCITLYKVRNFVLKVHSVNTIDLVQSSSYGAPGYFLLQNKKVPLVCRVSSFTPVYRSAYGRQRTFWEYLEDWLESSLITKSDATFSPSKSMAAIIEKIEAFKPDCIASPVDFQIIDEDYSFYNTYLAHKKYLLFFGTLSRIKGADLIGEMLPKVFEKNPSISCCFIGRDDGLPGGIKTLNYILDKCSMYTNRIMYFTAQSKSKLYPAIRHAEAVLHPSRVDNYPNACLEALTLGVPVVGTYDSSVEEIVEDGKTGFLAKNGDVESLSDSVNHLLQLDDVSRAQMKTNIANRIDKILNEDRINLLTIYYKKTIDLFKSKHHE